MGARGSGSFSSEIFADSDVLLKLLLVPEGPAAELAAEHVAPLKDLQGSSIVIVLSYTCRQSIANAARASPVTSRCCFREDAEVDASHQLAFSPLAVTTFGYTAADECP